MLNGILLIDFAKNYNKTFVIIGVNSKFITFSKNAKTLHFWVNHFFLELLSATIILSKP
jgi:hypothetical protein